MVKFSRYIHTYLYTKEFRKTSRHLRKKVLGPIIHVNSESIQSEDINVNNTVTDVSYKQRKPNAKKEIS